MAVFVRVVETGSFRAAATALNLSPSVVSHHVTRLEDRLGAALLYRSTRKISLTESGRLLFASSRGMVEEAQAGLNALADLSKQPVGRLRIAVTGAVFENPPFSDSLIAFAKAHPKIELSISFSDQKTQLIGSSFDAALRVGWLDDSQYMTRKLTDIELALVAAPAYIDGLSLNGPPSDFGNLDWIKLTQLSVSRHLMNAAGEIPDQLPRTAIEVDSVAALRRMVLSGIGATSLPRFLVDADLQQGLLVDIMPQWALMATSVYAVWPNNAPGESLTMRFVRFMAEHFSNFDKP